LRAEGFSCSLDVLYGGLGINQKKIRTIFQLYFLRFLVIKTLDQDTLEMLDLDPDPDLDSMNPDPQPWFPEMERQSGVKIFFNIKERIRTF
jgi:hypothetical protein